MMPDRFSHRHCRVHGLQCLAAAPLAPCSRSITTTCPPREGLHPADARITVPLLALPLHTLPPLGQVRDAARVHLMGFHPIY